MSPNPPIADLITKYSPIIKSKTILTTGVTLSSLGATFVIAVAAASPSLLILAGRNAEKLQETIAQIDPSVRTRALVVDLSSVTSVRRAAEEANSWDDVPQIDVVVNNAAVMAVDYKATEDNFEMQFATGHLGHFLLTNLIMDKILASKEPRVVSVSSDGHRAHPIRFADPHFSNGETYNRWYAYGQTKTANMLFAISLAEKLGGRGLKAFSLHPGVIMDTGLANHLDLANMEGDAKDLLDTDRAQGNSEGWRLSFEPVSLEVGAATHAYAAFDPDIAEHNGAYLLQCRLADPYIDTVKPWATSSIEADKLWKLSERILGQKFSY